MPRLNQAITDALGSIDDKAADVALYAISLINPLKWEIAMQIIREATYARESHVRPHVNRIERVVEVVP